MASKAVQMVCVALCAIGLIGVMTCCALPQWIVFRNRGNMEAHAGLWTVCQKDRTGPWECTAYDSRLPSSAEFQTARSMTIISCILGGLSLLLLIFGSDLIQCVQNEAAKTKMILLAVVGLLLAGLLVIIPVSWWTHDIYVGGETSGASIYIGYLAGVLMILIAGLLCWLSSRRSSSSGGTASFFSNRV